MAPQWFYIFGYYGSKNAGDEAFRLAFQQLLPTSAELRFIRPSQLAENQALASEIEQDVTGGRARLIVGGGAIIVAWLVFSPVTLSTSSLRSPASISTVRTALAARREGAGRVRARHRAARPARRGGPLLRRCRGANGTHVCQARRCSKLSTGGWQASLNLGVSKARALPGSVGSSCT
jgi:hypothetical protein